MSEGWAEVEAGKSVWGPCRSLVGGYVDENLGANGSDGMMVEVVGVPVDSVVRGDVRSWREGSQVVQRELNLCNAGIPLGNREVFVCTAKGGDEMVLRRSYSALGFVCAMSVRWDVLGFD